MDRSKDTKNLKYDAERLTEYHWDWLATLKLDSDPSFRGQATKLFDAWLLDLEETEGGRDFRWVRVTKPDSNYLHAVIGGFHSRRRHYEKKLKQVTASAVIERFDRSSPLYKYMIETLHHENYLDISYHF
jgi:hypothetical protein